MSLYINKVNREENFIVIVTIYIYTMFAYYVLDAVFCSKTFLYFSHLRPTVDTYYFGFRPAQFIIMTPDVALRSASVICMLVTSSVLI